MNLISLVQIYSSIEMSGIAMRTFVAVSVIFCDKTANDVKYYDVLENVRQSGGYVMKTLISACDILSST